MKKYMLMVCTFLWSVHTLAQSEIIMFQLIKQPVDIVLVDSLETFSDSSGVLGNIWGDSIEVSAICMVSDTSDINILHLEVGNDTNGMMNIYSDSLDFTQISTMDTTSIYRQGKVVYFNFGVFESSDTLFGESWLYRNNGTLSTVLYFPEY